MRQPDERAARQWVEVLGGGYVRLLGVEGRERDVVEAARGGAASGAVPVRLLERALLAGELAPFELVTLRLRTKYPAAYAWRLFPGAAAEPLHTPECYLPASLGLDRLGVARRLREMAEERARELIEAAYRVGLSTFETLVAAGVSRAEAALALPQAAFIEVSPVMTGAGLVRLIGRAQGREQPFEIRAAAEALLEVMGAALPLTAQAFRRTRVGARPPA